MRVVKRIFVFTCIFTFVAMVVANLLFLPFLTPSTAYAGSKKIWLNVKGMTSYANVAQIKEALTAVKGVKKAYVDFRNERAIVTVKKGTRPDALIKAIRKAGFKAYVAEKVEWKKKKQEENPYDDWQMDDPIGP